MIHKKASLLIFALSLLMAFCTGAFAQNGGTLNPTHDVPPTDQKLRGNQPILDLDLKNGIPKGSGRTFLYLGVGNNFLSQTPNGQGYLNKSKAFNAGLSLPIISKRRFSLRIETVLNYSFNTQNNLPALPGAYHVTDEVSSTVAYNSLSRVKQSSYKVDFGPQFNFHLGKRFSFGPGLMFGTMAFNQPEFAALQTTIRNTAVGTDTTKYTLLRKWEVSTGGVVLTPKLRINYLINNWIGIWGEINYSFGPNIKTNISKFTPQDTPNDSGYYDIFQLDHGATTTEETTTKYQSTSINVGLVFSFGHKKEKCPCDNVSVNSPPYEKMVPGNPKPQNEPTANKDSTNNKQDSTTCENLKARVEKISNADSIYYKLYIENKYTGNVSSFKPKIFKIIILDNSVIDIDESATRGWSRTPSKFPPGSTNVVWISNKEEIPNGEIKLGNVYFKDPVNNQFRILYEWQNKDGKTICSDSISLIAPPYYYDITYDANDNFTEISAKILNVQFNNEYTSNDLLKINIYDTKTSSQILSKNEKSTTVKCVSGQNRISIDLKDYALTPEKVFLLTISDTNISYQFKFKVTDKITNVREK